MDAHNEPFLFFAPLVGIWAAVIVWRSRRRARQSLRWPASKGLITQSVLADFGRGGEKAIVRYTYFTPDERQGCGLAPGGMLIANPASLVARFPKGREVLIRYNPENPNDSFLDSGVQAQILGLTFLAIIGIAFPFVYLIWIR